MEVGRFCAARGMTHYVYAPKDDPAHRLHWRDLYGPEELAGFEAMVADSGLVLGFGISPGLDIDAYSYDDRKALQVKVDQVVDLGAGLVMLAFDDIPFDPSGGSQARGPGPRPGRAPRRAGDGHPRPHRVRRHGAHALPRRPGRGSRRRRSPSAGPARPS